MVKHTGTLYVKRHIADEMERICREYSKKGIELNFRGVEFDEEFKFPNGMRMAIQVCCSSPDQPCWSQGVLYTPNGIEEGCTEVKGYFYGNYQVEYDTSIYEVEVAAV